MPDSAKRRVTLAEIAQASGVSLAAVSLALSDKPGISQETRARVLNAARALGYPVKTADMLAAQRVIQTIGLLVMTKVEGEPHVGNFYSHIIASIEATCQEMNLNLMIADLPLDRSHHPLRAPLLLEKGHVDGFLLAGLLVTEEITRILDRRGLPVVLFESYSPHRAYSAVRYDNVQGGYLATLHLIQKGHRQIGFVGGPAQDYPSLSERRVGYLKALAEHGIPTPYLGDVVVYSAQRSEIAACALNLVRQHPQITALACVNDDVAIAAISGLSEAGYSIPRDISVIGFDDIYLAENVVPALTTMRVHKQSMGRLAVQILLDRQFQEEGACVTSLFCPGLVERNSVANI